jgi:cathepsin B
MEEMQQEIYENGPITAIINVYNDLFSYHSGIYYVSFSLAVNTFIFKNKGGEQSYNHLIKIIGWGVEDNLPYWLCK